MDRFINVEDAINKAYELYEESDFVRAEKLSAFVKSIPAADVRPVLRGRWNVDGRCDKCGGHAPFWAMATTYYRSDFCPNCGADMREVEQK